MDVPAELTERSPDETHEALRTTLLAALARLEAVAADLAALTEQVAALVEPPP